MITTVLAAGLAVASALGIAGSPNDVSPADRGFIAMVGQGGLFEVMAGQAAADQGGSQDIRDQGVTEAHDHLLVGDKLTSIAADAGIRTGDRLNTQFQKELTGLKALSGPAFDAAYLSDMKAIHAKDGAAFAKEAESSSNPKLKAFAAETHRIVERHIGELDAVGPEK
jgi:putative membrane protein